MLIKSLQHLDTSIVYSIMLYRWCSMCSFLRWVHFHGLFMISHGPCLWGKNEFWFQFVTNAAKKQRTIQMVDPQDLPKQGNRSLERNGKPRNHGTGNIRNRFGVRRWFHQALYQFFAETKLLVLFFILLVRLQVKTFSPVPYITVARLPFETVFSSRQSPKTYCNLARVRIGLRSKCLPNL
jgi:hypothetical protein